MEGAAATPSVIIDITHEHVEQTLQQKNQSSVILDVRKFEEVAELGQIPSSHVLPVDDIESALRLSDGEFKEKYGFTKPTPTGPAVICYCRSGVRSTRAANMLCEQFGFTRVFNYRGSWNDWSERHPEHVKAAKK